ncbi:MAG TPA: LapA family protein [Burkholderiaceae bacterium]|nr:LapA family protein [Burkholderiaceae bacterium]
MRIFVWLFRAAIFFSLFAFALNNQHDATVKWFFGQEWHAPMVFIVLIAFALGAVFGVLAMVPSWWRHRRVARRHRPEPALPGSAAAQPPPAPLEMPVRDGL